MVCSMSSKHSLGWTTKRFGFQTIRSRLGGSNPISKAVPVAGITPKNIHCRMLFGNEPVLWLRLRGCHLLRKDPPVEYNSQRESTPNCSNVFQRSVYTADPADFG